MPALKGSDNPSFKHGYATRGRRPSIYYRWRSMIARCYAKGEKDYARYGAQGVEVCDRWRWGEGGRSGFELWLEDMGPPPFARASIDRIDNTKGYSPDNCRWATQVEQSNNRRSNRFVTARGQTLTIAQWARMVGIGPKTIRYRLEQGAAPEEAIFRVPDKGTKLNSPRKTK